MGSGNYDRALELAQEISSDGDTSLTFLFLAIDSLKNKDFKTANTYITQMPQGSLSEFMIPLLQSWTKAAHKNALLPLMN